MLLNGFGFSGYRSFGDRLNKVSPLKKVNLIIGKNNSGKSNIINFLKDHYPTILDAVRKGRGMPYSSRHTFKSTDKHLSSKPTEQRVSFPLFACEIDDYVESLLNANISTSHRETIKALLKSSYLADERGDVWFTFKSPDFNAAFSLELDVDKIFPALAPSQWNSLWRALTGNINGDIKKHWIPDTILKLVYIPSSTPNIEVIPAIRKIGAAGSQALDFSGEGIIERLAKIQNPSLTQQEDKEKFNAINAFLREVLENNSATIEIPHDRDMVLVHMDNKTLPLESLGTGVHEVVILAAAATILTNTILCVEEPELHLHPLLQKKLVKYLASSTDNQYFFTTHSAHLLDAVESEVFHVVNHDGESVINAIASTKERSNICNDLGYKASDILQANCVIWVEGPSDRIYLNYWISAKNPNLVEGIHYSIMFYGGRLFSHLSALDGDATDSKIDDFISIRKLNRNSSIVFDSDKTSPRSKLNATKKRLQAEFDSGPGFSWVTKGREIENYLNHDRLEKSVIAVHPSASKLAAKGQWENLLIYKRPKDDTEKTANKVKIARDYTQHNPVDFSILDLNYRINQLCSFILEANGD
ncbi:ATP-dependent nuclease [Ectopseudomonas khazarica]|uniref:ATP-dependent nuclease n=1 Tax=Ectopseudomonas khazarica TaxID=2502979 RepID=UPI0037CC0A2A